MESLAQRSSGVPTAATLEAWLGERFRLNSAALDIWLRAAQLDAALCSSEPAGKQGVEIPAPVSLAAPVHLDEIALATARGIAGKSSGDIR